MEFDSMLKALQVVKSRCLGGASSEYLDADQARYFAEIAYCKSVTALEVFGGGDFDAGFRDLRAKAQKTSALERRVTEMQDSIDELRKILRLRTR
jgi:hypothetical protein